MCGVFALSHGKLPMKASMEAELHLEDVDLKGGGHTGEAPATGTPKAFSQQGVDSLEAKLKLGDSDVAVSSRPPSERADISESAQNEDRPTAGVEGLVCQKLQARFARLPPPSPPVPSTPAPHGTARHRTASTRHPHGIHIKFKRF